MNERKVNLFSVIFALLSASAISLTLHLQTSNVTTAIMVLVLYFFYHQQWNEVITNYNKRKNIAVLVVTTILTCFICMHELEYLDDLYDLSGIGKPITLLCIATGYFVLFFLLLHWIYAKLEDITITNIESYHQSGYRIFIGASVLILLCWLPFYLKNYPAVIISDSLDQLGQAVKGNYSNHHPVVQTWILQFFVTLGLQVTGKMSIGIAAYCIIQMIILASIYAFVITECYLHKVKKWICICLFLFFAMMPYNVMYAINIWKDSLFSGALLLFTVLLWKLLREEYQTTRAILIEEILLVLSGCVITFFRNNGLYAFVAVVPFVCILCWKKSKYTVVAVLAVVLITLFVRGPIFTNFHVKSPDMIESLSIPAQQIARAIANDAELTQEEQNLLEQAADLSRVAKTYDEEVSDPIKNLVRETGNQEYLKVHSNEYIKVWLSIGMRYPMHYIRAYLHQTEGYWYPDVQRWVYTEGVSENSGGIVSEPKLPSFICELLGKGILWNKDTKIPVYGLFWSIGMAVWMTFIAAGFCLATNKKKELVLFLPMLALWVTLLAATPVNGEFRYIYSIFICLPFYMIVSKMDA